MSYNTELKTTIEPLALEYYNLNNSSIKNTNGLRKIEENIINGCVDYVLAVASKRHKCSSIQDLRQEVIIGIIEAIRTYEPDKGSFLTWVVHKIKNKINREKADHWIKIPSYIREVIPRYRKFINSWYENNSREPTVTEISQATNLSIKIINKIENVIGFSKHSIDNILSPNIQDTIAYKETHELENIVALKIDTDSASSKLTSQQKLAIKYYFIDGFTIKEIVEELELPPNAVKKIIDEAKKILSNELKEYNENK